MSTDSKVKSATEIQRLWRGYKSRRQDIVPCKRCELPICLSKKKRTAYSWSHCSWCNEYINKVETEYRNWQRDPNGSIYPPHDLHYCGEFYCPGDCGVLACGCIDVCRRHRNYRYDY